MGVLCCENHVLFSYIFFRITCDNFHSCNRFIFYTKKENKKTPLNAGFYCYSSLEYLPDTYRFLFLYTIPFQLFTVSPVYGYFSPR